MSIFFFSSLSITEAREVFLALLDKSTLPFDLKSKAIDFINSTSDEIIEKLKNTIDDIIISVLNRNLDELNKHLQSLKIPKVFSALISIKIMSYSDDIQKLTTRQDFIEMFNATDVNK